MGTEPHDEHEFNGGMHCPGFRIAELDAAEPEIIRPRSSDEFVEIMVAYKGGPCPLCQSDERDADLDFIQHRRGCMLNGLDWALRWEALNG